MNRGNNQTAYTDAPRFVRVINTETTDAPPYACLEVARYDAEADIFYVRKPTESNRNDLLFGFITPIFAGQEGQAVAGVPALVTVRRDAAYPPTAGEIWGCVAGDWLLNRSGTGYTILAYPSEAVNLAIVRHSPAKPSYGIRPATGATSFNAAAVANIRVPVPDPAETAFEEGAALRVVDLGGWLGLACGSYRAERAVAVDWVSSEIRVKVGAYNAMTGLYAITEVAAGGAVRSGGVVGYAKEMNGNALVPLNAIVKANLSYQTTTGTDPENNDVGTVTYEFYYESGEGGITTGNTTTPATGSTGDATTAWLQAVGPNLVIRHAATPGDPDTIECTAGAVTFGNTTTPATGTTGDLPETLIKFVGPYLIKRHGAATGDPATVEFDPESIYDVNSSIMLGNAATAATGSTADHLTGHIQVANDSGLAANEALVPGDPSTIKGLPASTTLMGMINTLTQSFKGNKTFVDLLRAGTDLITGPTYGTHGFDDAIGEAFLLKCLGAGSSQRFAEMFKGGDVIDGDHPGELKVWDKIHAVLRFVCNGKDGLTETIPAGYRGTYEGGIYVDKVAYAPPSGNMSPAIDIVTGDGYEFDWTNADAGGTASTGVLAAGKYHFTGSINTQIGMKGGLTELDYSYIIGRLYDKTTATPIQVFNTPSGVMSDAIFGLARGYGGNEFSRDFGECAAISAIVEVADGAEIVFQINAFAGANIDSVFVFGIGATTLGQSWISWHRIN